MLANTAALFAALGYAFATALLIRKQTDIAISNNIILLSVIAASLHTLSLALEFILHKGLSSSFFDAISLTTLIIVLVTIGSRTTRQVSSILIPVFLVSGFCVLLSIYFGHFKPITTPSTGMLVHILSSIAAYVLLCLAALQAVLLYLTEQGLKKKTNNFWVSSAPPMQSTEGFLFRLIIGGWLLLSVSLMSGLIFIDNIFAQHLVHKTAFSMISWLLFTALLIGRHLRGWRGSIAATWTIWAFAALMLAYFGSKFVLDVILNRL